MAEAVAIPARKNFQDLTGLTFGRVTILHYVGAYRDKGNSMWFCRCRCGTEKVMIGTALVRGRTLSCGCLAREMATTHGMRRRPEYRIWHHLLDRCLNESDESFPNYGGRGITVCSRWQGQGGFINFFTDIGPRPSAEHQIDRKDNDGPYSSENCHWATRKEQSRNRRTNRHLIFNGQKRTLSEWAETFGIKFHTLRLRIELGWTAQAALTTPVDQKRRRKVSHHA